MTITSPKCFSHGLIGALLMALVSPVWALTPIEVAKLTASDEQTIYNDQFGRSVAVNGDTALIGALTDPDKAWFGGASYLFTRSGGVWIEQAKLISSDAADFDLFGISVALDGDTALIGASGDAYVFVSNGGEWTEQAKLTASDGAEGDTFGRPVALDRDTALVGARCDDDHGYCSGSAYIFTGSGGDWIEQAKLTASDGAASDLFGEAVALEGDTALIGALGDDDNGSASGSAYVFTRSGGEWIEQAKLTGSDGAANHWFGRSVALDGDTALVGARCDDDHGYCSGSAYIFTGSGGDWIEQAKLTASDGETLDHFGSAVALDGHNALIGAYRANEESGSAYVFTRRDGKWIEQAKLTPSDGAAGDWFGVSVTLDGDNVLIGSSHDDDNGSDSGSAYLFSISGLFTVTIDIIPGAEFNRLNPNSNGLVDVAILTEGAFDALQLDPNTARFGPGEAAAEHYTVADVESDGNQDLVLHFSVQDTLIACGDTQATLTGVLYDGTEVTGMDAITTVGCLGDTVSEAESMVLSDGYSVESNADASGGQIIRGLVSSSYPARASTIFSGVAGSYDIAVSYFDELDGQSSLAFLLNGEMLDRWIADKDPRCRDCASPNARTRRTRVVATNVQLSPGDEIVLEGMGDYFEYARFDNITLSRVDLEAFEAEDMILDYGYVVAANADASGGQIIQLLETGGYPAQASSVFTGAAGAYDIEVSYFDELDGQSRLAFLLNGAMLDEWIADEDPRCRDCASPNARTLRTRVVARGVRLSPGDEIALQGAGDYYEYARFDNITLSRVGLETLEAEDMILDDGYVVEANADASGGQLIRRLDSGGYAATASTQYTGSAGAYDIAVSYFDEYDGMSSLAFLLNGEMLDQWIADEDPACRECASPNETTLRSRVVARNVRLSTGDEITLQGTGEHYEYARFDKITFHTLEPLPQSPVVFDDGGVHNIDYTIRAEEVHLKNGTTLNILAGANLQRLVNIGSALNVYDGKIDSIVGAGYGTSVNIYAGSIGSIDIDDPPGDITVEIDGGNIGSLNTWLPYLTISGGVFGDFHSKALWGKLTISGGTFLEKVYIIDDYAGYHIAISGGDFNEGFNVRAATVTSLVFYGELELVLLSDWVDEDRDRAYAEYSIEGTLRDGSPLSTTIFCSSLWRGMEGPCPGARIAVEP